MSGTEVDPPSAQDARGVAEPDGPGDERRRAGMGALAGRLAGGALTIISAIAVLAMLVNIVLDVLLRALFNDPITGTLELTTYYYMIAIAFIGAFTAQRRLEHIEVTAFVDRMGPTSKLYFSVAADLITLGFLAALIYYGWDIAMGSLEEREVAGATQLVVWPTRFLVPFGLAAYAVQLLMEMIGSIRRGAAPETEDLSEQAVV